jgi:hypothetical protein
MGGPEIKGTISPDDLPIVKRTSEWVYDEDHGAQQFRILRKDGQARHVEIYGRFTTYWGKAAVIGMIVDVTA